MKDLRVMVPAKKFEEAKEWGADIIGLSGLITPSLDEMIHVAKTMRGARFQNAAYRWATTSNAHTAIKISSNYDQPTVRVGDASLVTGVCSACLIEEGSFCRRTGERERSSETKIRLVRTNRFSQHRRSEGTPISFRLGYCQDHPSQLLGGYG